MKNTDKDEYVVISNDSLAYEIIIMDQGFSRFLMSVAKPKWYYSPVYYKMKNKLYVAEWNSRVYSNSRFSRDLYQQTIDYDGSINYGLEVDYKLYNYFKFVEYKYKVMSF